MSAQLNRLLKGVTDLLDLPPELYRAAVSEAERLGNWMRDHDLDAGRREPKVYQQGSSRLGTVVRPIREKEEYDIDLVYLRQLKKSIGQPELVKQAKENIESYRAHLKAAGEEVPELEEGRRCLTLLYDGQFHMDVLPAIPDEEADTLTTAIWITDKELSDWKRSDPKGYAEWFKSKAREEFEARSLELLQAGVEGTPDWQIKTDLQRVVQILKRHRDIRFEPDDDLKPISIIITTLAARAYRRSETLYESLMTIIGSMRGQIKEEDGEYVVSNPANDGENFADKWRENPGLANAFFDWIDELHSDFQALDGLPIADAQTELERYLGAELVSEATAGLDSSSETALAVRDAAIPVLASVSHRAPPTWTMRPTKRAKIVGSIRRREGSTRKLWALTHRPVPKGFWIRFEVKTNVRGDYRVFWQVTNTGAEAVAADGLRGDFDEGYGGTGRVRWEHAGYRGTHTIQAFVVKDEVVVARSQLVKVRVP